MTRDIKQFPIKPSIIITVFKGDTDYNLSKDGTIIFNNKYVENDFYNINLKFKNHTLHQIGKDATEKKLSSFFKDNKIESDYDGEFTSEDILFEFLEKQGYDSRLNKNENLFVIIPKIYKKPKGEKFVNTFNVCSESFKYGDYVDFDLDVFMTPITKDVKKILFRVDIPDYIYDKCMQDNNVNNRPSLKYIESENLAFIHNKMGEYSSMAISIHQEQIASEKYIKKIFVNFSSVEVSERDSYNFAYTGQNIKTSFNWFICYEYSKNTIMGGTSYFTFLKKESNFSSIKTNYNLSKDIHGVVDLQPVNGKCYFQSKPNGVILDWTQEREDFCRDIENNFRQLSDNLNHFLYDLDNQKIDLLISNSNFKFIN